MKLDRKQPESQLKKVERYARILNKPLNLEGNNPEYESIKCEEVDRFDLPPKPIIEIGSQYNTQIMLESAKSVSNAKLLTQGALAIKPPLYYRLAIQILAPLYRLQIWKRSRHNDNYLQEIADRFGKRYNKKIDWSPSYQVPNQMQEMPIIWCHSVSLGETNTIAPLLDRLLNLGYRVFLTNTTQTGYHRGKTRFARQISNGQLRHAYLPIDKPAVVEKFLNNVQPMLAMFVETELWANTLYLLSQKDISSVLVNGRLSKKSFHNYQKIDSVSQSMMKNLSLIIAQDAESARYFRELGAESAKIRVSGSLKWTVSQGMTEKTLGCMVTKDSSVYPKIKSDKYVKKSHSFNINEFLEKDFKHGQAERNHTYEKTKNDNQEKAIDKEKQDYLAKVAKVCKNRPVWIVASSHEGEEAVALAAHHLLLAQNNSQSLSSNTLLIIVPRHPERFDKVAEQIEASGLSYCRRSHNEVPVSNIENMTQVFLADSMGELMQWYQLANMAFVGGSIVNIGGHNPIEAIVAGTPVIMGKFTQSCQAIINELKSEDILQQLQFDYQHKKGKPLSDEVVLKLAEELKSLLLPMLSNKNYTMDIASKGQRLVNEKQSIIESQLQMILDLIQ